MNTWKVSGRRNWLSDENTKWSLLNVFDKSTRQTSFEKRPWHNRLLALCGNMEKIISKGPFKSSTPVIVGSGETRALTRTSLKDKASKFRLL